MAPKSRPTDTGVGLTLRPKMARRWLAAAAPVLLQWVVFPCSVRRATTQIWKRRRRRRYCKNFTAVRRTTRRHAPPLATARR